MQINENINSEGVVVLAVAMPPPVHGQSKINYMIACALVNSSKKCIIANISPNNKTKTNISYHVTRLVRCLKAILVLFSVCDERKKTAYFVYESGYGFIYNIFLCLVARFLKYSIVMHHHTSEHCIRKSIKFSFVAWLCGPAAQHIVLTEKMLNDIVFRYKLNRVLINSNAGLIDCVDEIRRSSLGPRRLKIGLLSNLTLEKGVKEAIALLKIAILEGLDVELILAGPIKDSGSELLIKQAMLDFKDRVIYIGPIYENAKVGFFKNIDVFIFPTKYKFEAQPLVVLEALAYSVPALVISKGYTAECVPSKAWVSENSDEFIKIGMYFIKKWMHDEEAYISACSDAYSFYKLNADASKRQLQNLLSCF